ncbi:DEFECTIVE 1273 PROTEIN putative-RELATED [Salix viminalis]|uniref:DEFECTIVE 1273 PROTEIN putative-RELATED n=1 Tax=Salix viminalis TaxID=40686 RepID=A0A9Q0UTR9_SALVM|nr:DEFECTIVE 1273 PROTEIN putative-RELATED [Salix viminalis]
MALLASSTLPSSPQYQIKVFRNKPCQFRWCLLSHAPHQISPTCSIKVTKAHFGEPSKVKLQLNIVKERWLRAIPDSVKEFPWRKAEDLLLKQLLLVGQKAFKSSCWLLDDGLLERDIHGSLSSFREKRAELAPSGLQLLLHSCEGHFNISHSKYTAVSFACCKWWVDASFVDLG